MKESMSIIEEDRVTTYNFLENGLGHPVDYMFCLSFWPLRELRDITLVGRPDPWVNRLPTREECLQRLRSVIFLPGAERLTNSWTSQVIHQTTTEGKKVTVPLYRMDVRPTSFDIGLKGDPRLFLKERFIQNLIESQGDGAMAIFKTFAHPTTPLRYRFWGKQSERWRPFVFKCAGCGMYSSFSRGIRAHVTWCSGWDTLDMMASRLFFTTDDEMSVALDKFLEDGFDEQLRNMKSLHPPNGRFFQFRP